MLLTKYEQMKVVCMDYKNLYLYCDISWRCFSHVLFSGPFRWWWKAPQEDLQKNTNQNKSSKTNRPSSPAKASLPAWLLGKSAGWIDKKAGTTLSRYRSPGTSETATGPLYIRTFTFLYLKYFLSLYLVDCQLIFIKSIFLFDQLSIDRRTGSQGGIGWLNQ